MYSDDTMVRLQGLGQHADLPSFTPPAGFRILHFERPKWDALPGHLSCGAALQRKLAAAVLYSSRKRGETPPERSNGPVRLAFVAQPTLQPVRPRHCRSHIWREAHSSGLSLN